jgi:phenylalanyl-tRNA synthetase beta chain
VKVGPSPEWVVKHLESIGERSINNIVDAANIVMYDCGQPAHIFDLDSVMGALVIRQAHEGEKMTTLDNRNLELQDQDLVVADIKNALGLAGVKGGKIAEVNNDTKNLIIEVANFDPVSTRRSGQRLGIFTDARKRFENDLSPELVPYAMRELSATILEMCPDAIFEDIVDVYPHTNNIGVGVYPKKQEERKLSFSAERISKILGVAVSMGEIKDILGRYNFSVKGGSASGGEFEIKVPPMRLDLVIEEDMAEEIGRILGYDKVKPKIPKINFEPKANETYAKISWARNKLLGEGYCEVMTYTFHDKGEVEVQKSASDKKFLRTNLTDGLKQSLKLNQLNAPLLGQSEIKIFEIGTIFIKNGEETNVAFGDKKEIKEMTLNEFCKSASPDAFAQDFLLRNVNRSQKHASEAFKVWSMFPFISRDVALWVPEGVSSIEVMKVIKENAGEFAIRGPELFDEFKKDGKTSYAFRLVFQSYDRTLTDTEVNAVMAKINEKINKKSWQVR